MANGVIRRLITDRGFGFIKTEDEKDLFFHRSGLQGVEFDTLREGQEVEFDMGKGRDGRSQAVGVRLTDVEVKEELPSAEDTTEAPEAVEEDSPDDEVREELPSAEETTEEPEAVKEDSTDAS